MLYLDGDNPRFDPKEDEPQIIKALVGKEKILELASDLVLLGASPLERLAVMPHPTAKSAYVVLEGNRRVCAAKLLADPAKAPSPVLREQLRKLATGRDFSRWELDVVVFADRQAAKPWILRRHTGQKEGTGSKKWESAAITRFAQQEGSSDLTNSLALAVVDYAEGRQLITAANREGIALTTVTRMLSTPAVRDALGIAKSAALNFYAPQDEVDPAIAKFLTDVQTGANHATSRSSAEDRRLYAHQLRQAGHAPTTRWSTPQPAPQPADGSPSTGSQAKAAKRDSRHPALRTHVIPPDFKAAISDPGLRRIYGELKTLDCDLFPLAASSLLRTFIEVATARFLKKQGLEKPEFHQVLLATADALLAAGVKPSIVKPIKVMGSSKDNRMSAHSMGAGVHGSLLMSPSDLKRHWDELTGVMHEILARQ